MPASPQFALDDSLALGDPLFDDRLVRHGFFHASHSS